MLVILSGVSGSGKNTIINELLKDKSLNLEYLKNCTTRSMRDYEKLNPPYIFISKEEFLKKIENNEFFEYEDCHGNFYGTLKSSINDIILGKVNYIKDFGVLGQKFIVESLKDKVKIVSIFINVPENILRERLVLRGEKEIEKRMSRMKMELEHKNNFDYVVDNIDLNEAVQNVKKIILKEM